MNMKKEALKLADELENTDWWQNHEANNITDEASAMIRRLVEELDKPHKYDPETGEPLIDGYPLFSGLPRQKPLSDEEIDIIKYAVSSAICSLESEINEQEKTFKGYEHCSNLSGLREELNDCLKAKDILERHGIK